MDKIKFYIIFCFFTSLVLSCTDLVEKPLDGVIPTQKDGDKGFGSSDLITIKKEIANLYSSQEKMYGLDESSTDSSAGPTRAGDWDDNGVWRQIHAHTFGPDHVFIKNFYNNCLTGIFNCDLLITNASQSAFHNEAKFLKAFLYYHMIDKFGVVPYRTDLKDVNAIPEVYTRKEATAQAISLLDEVADKLPSKEPKKSFIASKEAAYHLLAKFYLNKDIFDNEPTVSPTFSPENMNKVIENVNKINMTLNPPDESGSTYWKNFSPNNDDSGEIIYAISNTKGQIDFGRYEYLWRMSTHYNLTPSGWNGPVILGEYYDKFLAHNVPEDGDKRATYSTPDIIKNFGNPVGILRGQMYAPGGTVALNDRKKNPLIFTKEVDLVISDKDALEVAGYRPMKYIPDNDDLDRPENDFVIFRYADALLMAAEASLRGGTTSISAYPDATAIVNAIRARVGLGALSNVDLNELYDVRARELWLEFFRRNDMIRFGKFLEEKELKKYTSDVKYLLYPLPTDALLNPNITQNPGY